MLLPAAQPIWSLPLEQVVEVLLSGPEGLSQAEAAARLERWGANRLPPQRRRPLILRLLDQMVHFMALLLWIAGALAFAAGTPQLGWAIWSVVLINGLFSFWQEYQAERTLAALIRALPSQVQVWRGQGVGLMELRELAPALLQHRAPAAVQAVQTQASTVTFALIVAAQMGALLACRSDFRPFWQVLRRPNRLLWLGFASEPVVAAILVLVPPLAQAFGTAPFPIAWLGPMLLAPLAVLTADSLHKLLRPSQ